MDLEATNPTWKLSFPHVLVATITSFLFGYHLGFVCYLKLNHFVVCLLFYLGIIVIVCEVIRLIFIMCISICYTELLMYHLKVLPWILDSVGIL